MCPSPRKETPTTDNTSHDHTRKTTTNLTDTQPPTDNHKNDNSEVDAAALALAQLTGDQRRILAAIVSRLDTQKDSVVLTNPLVSNGPIVHVTEAWQQMCGYKASEALGRNPKVTQGVGTDKSVLASMRLALQEQRPCKVRLLNYRGGEGGEPFWNSLTVHPVFREKQLVLYIARLRDYSFRMTKLVALQPEQFCKEPPSYFIELSSVRSARQFAAPVCIIESAADAPLQLPKPLDDDDRESRIQELDDAGDLVAAPPPPPVQHVKRLALADVQLDPEYIADRVRDECLQLNLHCSPAPSVSAHDSTRIEICTPTAAGTPSSSSVRAFVHVIPQSCEGDYKVSFTRLSGDTFAFHKLYRELKSRISDVLAPARFDLPPFSA